MINKCSLKLYLKVEFLIDIDYNSENYGDLDNNQANAHKIIKSKQISG